MTKHVLILNRQRRNRLMKKIIGFLVVSALPWCMAQANIHSDYEAGLPFAQIINNSVSDGNTVSNTFSQLLDIAPQESGAIISAAINADSKQTVDLVNIALQASVDLALVVKLAVQTAPEHAGAIVDTAKKYSDKELGLIKTAIEAGADPSVIGEAPAAGRGRPVGFNLLPIGGNIPRPPLDRVARLIRRVAHIPHHIPSIFGGGGHASPH